MPSVGAWCHLAARARRPLELAPEDSCGRPARDRCRIPRRPARGVPHRCDPDLRRRGCGEQPAGPARARSRRGRERPARGRRVRGRRRERPRPTRARARRRDVRRCARDDVRKRRVGAVRGEAGHDRVRLRRRGPVARRARGRPVARDAREPSRGRAANHGGVRPRAPRGRGRRGAEPARPDASCDSPRGRDLPSGAQCFGVLVGRPACDRGRRAVRHDPRELRRARVARPEPPLAARAGHRAAHARR